MSAECKTFGMFAVLLFSDVKFVNTFHKDTQYYKTH